MVAQILKIQSERNHFYAAVIKAGPDGFKGSQDEVFKEFAWILTALAQKFYTTEGFKDEIILRDHKGHVVGFGRYEREPKKPKDYGSPDLCLIFACDGPAFEDKLGGRLEIRRILIEAAVGLETGLIEMDGPQAVLDIAGREIGRLVLDKSLGARSEALSQKNDTALNVPGPA
jgi:hypothetical protein